MNAFVKGVLTQIRNAVADMSQPRIVILAPLDQPESADIPSAVEDKKVHVFVADMADEHPQPKRWSLPAVAFVGGNRVTTRFNPETMQVETVQPSEKETTLLFPPSEKNRNRSKAEQLMAIQPAISELLQLTDDSEFAFTFDSEAQAQRRSEA